jgi:hypothetical protein
VASGVFRLLLAAALGELVLLGYPVLACALALSGLLLIAGQRDSGLQGAVLCWRAGQWTLEHGPVPEEISLQRAHCLSWLTHAQWRSSSGKVYRLWLPNHCGDAEQLRRLRVRLSLECGV